jgi:predicted nucleic acid-binding Zn ribbon protein
MTKPGHELIEKYPKLFVEAAMTPFESCLGRGVECHKGWFPLLDKLCAMLQNISDAEQNQIVLKQVKEKLARLTVYWQFERPKDVKPETYNLVLGIVSGFSEASTTICEECGKPGRVTTENSWRYTSCPECMAARAKRWADAGIFEESEDEVGT